MPPVISLRQLEEAIFGANGKCENASLNGCRRDPYYPNGWCGNCFLIRHKASGRYADFSERGRDGFRMSATGDRVRAMEKASTPTPEDLARENAAKEKFAAASALESKKLAELVAKAETEAKELDALEKNSKAVTERVPVGPTSPPVGVTVLFVDDNLKVLPAMVIGIKADGVVDLAVFGESYSAKKDVRPAPVDRANKPLGRGWVSSFFMG